VDSRVRLDGLQSGAGTSLNGLTGTVTGYAKAKDRWQVVLDGDQQEKLLKGINLFPLDVVTTASEVDTAAGLCASCSQPLPAVGQQCPACSLAERGVETPRGVWQVRPEVAPVPKQALNSRTAARAREYSEPPSWRHGRAGEVEPERTPLVVQLRQMLAEWQGANTQWQVAYAQMSERCMQLEGENKHLLDVVEAAESGPDMNARFVARLARQNLRLGQEAASRGVATENGDTPTLGSREASSSDDDSARGRRPAGVKRLPLHRHDEPPAVTHSQWDKTNESTSTDEDESAMPEYADKPDPQSKENAEDRRRDGQRCRELFEERRSLEANKLRDSRHTSSSGSTLSMHIRLTGYAVAFVSVSVMAITFFVSNQNGQAPLLFAEL